MMLIAALLIPDDPLGCTPKIMGKVLSLLMEKYESIEFTKRQLLKIHKNIMV
jgi:hypothetical protein